MSKSNWDTEEMGRWIANDPVLYYETHPEVDVEDIVNDWLAGGRPVEFNVNLNEVDWSAVL